jgi:hypothetical protein
MCNFFFLTPPQSMPIIQQKDNTRTSPHCMMHYISIVRRTQKSELMFLHEGPQKLIFTNSRWTTHKNQFAFVPFLSKYKSNPSLSSSKNPAFVPFTTTKAQSRDPLFYTRHQSCSIHHVPLWDGLLQNPVL